MAEKATEGVQNERSEAANFLAKNTANESETLIDKFCSDQSCENPSDNELVEMILLTADCQAYWSDTVFTKLVDEKLGNIGIRMKSIIVNRNVRRCFESCIVAIEPTKRSY